MFCFSVLKDCCKYLGECKNSWFVCLVVCDFCNLGNCLRVKYSTSRLKPSGQRQILISGSYKAYKGCSVEGISVSSEVLASQEMICSCTGD